MDLNDFIEHFAEQFDETEKIVFTAETVVKELERVVIIDCFIGNGDGR